MCQRSTCLIGRCDACACRRADREGGGERGRVRRRERDGDREAGGQVRLLLRRQGRRAARLRGVPAVPRPPHLAHQPDHPQPNRQQGTIPSSMLACELSNYKLINGDHIEISDQSFMSKIISDISNNRKLMCNEHFWICRI
jgi:hypothetical protein